MVAAPSFCCRSISIKFLLKKNTKMKIIGAGLPKTGTKTLHAALNDLGYEVYDFLEHIWDHGKQWKDILTDGGSPDVFKKMYENVDAVVDTPVCIFWEEIHEAFPEAKIILMVREESAWLSSVNKQLITATRASLPQKLINYFCPTARKFHALYCLYGPVCFASRFEYNTKPNKLTLKRKYREHNNYVMQNAPKDKLLVFNVKEGWEPLCRFLGKEIPEKPFPWKNKKGSDIGPMIHRHPSAKQIKKEVLILCACFIAVLGVFLYYCFRILTSNR